MTRWTDARLDDLNERVADMGRRMDSGFDRTVTELRDLRGEMKSEIGSLRSEMKSEIGSLRSEVRSEIGSLRGEFAALHRLVLQAAAGMFATFAIGFLGIIATQL